MSELDTYFFISVVYNDFTLMATVSNQKVYIIKKENERS